MSIPNLDQIRAGNALKAATANTGEFRGEEGGEAVKKIPTEIRTNGLLGSAAFAIEKKGRGAVYEKAILPHLKSRWPEIPTRLDAFVTHVSAMDSAFLRVLTAETMAYLNYLRRFVKGS